MSYARVQDLSLIVFVVVVCISSASHKTELSCYKKCVARGRENNNWIMSLPFCIENDAEQQ